MSLSPKSREYKWTSQRILIAIWAIDFVAVLVAFAHPVSIGIVRLLIAASIPFLWLLAIFLVRRKRALAIIAALLGFVSTRPARSLP